jgi:hypothetical protein
MEVRGRQQDLQHECYDGRPANVVPPRGQPGRGTPSHAKGCEAHPHLPCPRRLPR